MYLTHLSAEFYDSWCAWLIGYSPAAHINVKLDLLLNRVRDSKGIDGGRTSFGQERVIRRSWRRSTDELGCPLSSSGASRDWTVLIGKEREVRRSWGGICWWNGVPRSVCIYVCVVPMKYWDNLRDEVSSHYYTQSPSPPSILCIITYPSVYSYRYCITYTTSTSCYTSAM